MQTYLDPLDKLKSTKIIEAHQAIINPPATVTPTTTAASTAASSEAVKVGVME